MAGKSKKSKRKKDCCEKPPHKRCKQCPLRKHHEPPSGSARRAS